MAVKYDDLQSFRDEISVKNNETLQEQHDKWEKEIDSFLTNDWRNVAYNPNPYLTVPFSRKTPELVKMIMTTYSKAGWQVEKSYDQEDGKNYLTFRPQKTHSNATGFKD
jgi:hypothetical protein